MGLPFLAVAQGAGGAALPATMQLHQQAEEVFQRGDYERAMFIYRHELVPIGDKYGQYMVGFMYMTGKGVPQDGIQASAWYRLAAERGTREFVQLADNIVASMTPAQREQSDAAYLMLRQQFSDAAVFLRSARADYEALQTRSATTPGEVAVTILRTDSRLERRSRAAQLRDVEDQMKAKVKRVADEIGLQQSAIDYDDIDWKTLNASVVEYLNKLD